MSSLGGSGQCWAQGKDSGPLHSVSVCDSQLNSNANTSCPFLKTLNVNLAQLLISMFDVCGPHSADEEMEAHKGKIYCPEL